MTKEPDLEHPSPEDTLPPRQTWRVLFLDSAENVDLLKGACLDCGYVVVGATSIEEAFAFLDGKDHADVIVCGAHLPDESMFEFLRRVRGNEQHRETTFLILSLESGSMGSRLDGSTAKLAKELGADGYLVQPVFDAAELVAQIRKLQPAVPVLQDDDRERPAT